MKKSIFILCMILIASSSCKKDDPEPEPEAKRQTIYDTTKVIDRHVDSIFHHFYDSIYHHFYDTTKLTVYDTVRVPIISDHSWVIYNWNYGTEEVDTVEIKNGLSINLKSDATRFGYDLVKWSTDKTGSGTSYNPGDNYYVNQDITLYAIWQSHEGLHDYEVYDFLANKENGSTVDVKIIDLSPDFTEIKRALDKFWKVKVNLDLSDANDVTSFSYLNEVTNVISIRLPPNIIEIYGHEWVESNNYKHPCGGISGMSAITSLTIPNGVEILSIENCDNLSSIIIPETVKILKIYSCPKLKDINIPNGVESIYLEKIDIQKISLPNSVQQFGGVRYCTNLTEITIPESVESMYMNFEGCTNLKTVKHSLKECSGVNFLNCQNLTSIILPEFRPEYSYIDGNAFRYCSSLTSIIIPEGVKSIGYDAFSGCSSLTSIIIPKGVTSIGYEAFFECSSLTSITIPESVTSIGYDAFYGCSSFTSITIPKNVSSIGAGAFFGCSSLTSIIIPEGVTSIGYNVFGSCSNLTSLKIENTTPPSLSNGWISYSGSIYVPSSAVDTYKTAEVWKDHADQIVGY